MVYDLTEICGPPVSLQVVESMQLKLVKSESILAWVGIDITCTSIFLETSHKD